MTPTYNRKTKKYEVTIQGTLVEFDDKPAAQKFLIAAANPELFTAIKKLIERWPMLESRAWKAAMLYLSNSVVAHKAFVSVRSQADPSTTYQVTAVSCNCADHDNYAPTGPGHNSWCKHMIAAAFHHKLTKLRTVTHRGRTVRQPVTPGLAGHYANGNPIPAKLLPDGQVYFQRHGRWPPDQEKLISWVYR